MNSKTVVNLVVAIAIISGCIAIGFSAIRVKSQINNQQIYTPNKIHVEIVAVYQVPGGAWETCLKREDESRTLWTNHKLGQPGDKFFIWSDGKTEWLQDPRL